MKSKALFLSNQLFLDQTKNEGGVRVCTLEYLELIEKIYQVEIFPVQIQNSFFYRIMVRLGLNAYMDYNIHKYKSQLERAFMNQDIDIVFLNLSNTAPFAKVIKGMFGNKVKIVLCSHGNESGDFLHAVSRFQNKSSIFLNIINSYVLGKMLRKEAAFRQFDLDAVMTVSEVEESLEKWLGARQVLMVPRTIGKQTQFRKPVRGCYGFIGDLSHAPNFHGINDLCQALDLIGFNNRIDIRLVGSTEKIGLKLASKYSFVTYLGYLDNEALKKEIENWSFFLNPVFYYSRGVSTKLSKALSWGIPIITSTIGCRGYKWRNGTPIMAETPKEMAEVIIEFSQGMDSYMQILENTEKIIDSAPSINDNAELLSQLIGRL